MVKDDDFRVRPGRIRSRGSQRGKPFIAQVLAASHRAGGPSPARSDSASSSKGPRRSMGRGRAATLAASRFLNNRSRGVVIKARVVRNTKGVRSMAGHVAYLRREGVSKDGVAGGLFDADHDDVDGHRFAKRCGDDRHHFRFIVSPDDAIELGDLKTFARDLMAEMEKDLGTQLDWVGVDHWNTEHAHLHILVRGVADDGENLVIDRDYIREGMRSRARDILTQELGPRTDLDIRRSIERQIETERWTQLDRALVRQASIENGIVDLRPDPDNRPDEFHVLKVGRLRKLEKLGLAQLAGEGQWIIDDKAEATLRELGERGDIIKRIHRGLTESGIEWAASDYVLAGEVTECIVGRLVARGLDNELSGSAYAVIDGVDGRIHHVRLPDLDAAGDCAPGSVVELRSYGDRGARRRMTLAVRSDLSIENQIQADGATWLDRQLFGNANADLADSGFGGEVKAAMEARAERLVEEGLAGHGDDGITFRRNLLSTLRRRELERVAANLSAETGLSWKQAEAGDHISGLYRQRVTLASGRFAMIDDGLGFQLVPWAHSVEPYLGRQVSGIARNGGGVDWNFGRKRGIGL
ncbi:type VI secretion protein [Paramesorhizobium deserti]|uniref:Type VI secretion protein n=1 Tax=Paramesorhizobium deserti TaxID=1494590 RepID=A0A135I1U3_9HYPH|nr:VirD2 family relaxase/mobilization nuclease [Paramesorhizobium deserti]KXF79420.1 type VI secretion protein [Paramesorhizobium deserti]